MKYAIAFILSAACSSALPVMAQTCVGDAFDTPFPRAVAVEIRHADVPSSRFPGMWQEGFLNGYFYQIFANHEAALSDGTPDPNWSIFISCRDDICQKNASGLLPEGAGTVASLLEICLTEPTLSGGAVDQALAGPQIDVVVDGAEGGGEADEVTDSAIEVVDAPPCGLATLPEGTQGQDLQQLLVLAGADPGWIDGIVGPRTRRAIVEILGPLEGPVDVPNAIAELDAVLCRDER
ncbi:peptidoglycan-binding domain-containing protein [Celeribacter sp.]|uniref:peptidoglycan-binding domain-containing protein n=1 Tax=Celeribacter sp. TaxID=1890673 RepID=UPI003A8F9DA7